MAAVGAFTQVGPFQFQPPREFSGRREDFEEFVFKLRAYLSLINPEYDTHLTALQDRADELTDVDFQDDQGRPKQDLIQMSQHLQWLLVSLCSGSASTFLRRETTMNGFESFRKLCQRYMLPSRAKSVGRLTRILKPNFNMDAFEDSFSVWEDDLVKYEKETKTKLSDDIRIAVLMTEIRGPLQEHLRLNAATVTKYEDFKDIIVNYFRIKQHYKTSTNSNDNSSNNMDVGAFWRKGKGKFGFKGKGKGKGKYSFKGKGKGKGKFNGGFKGKSFGKGKGKSKGSSEWKGKGKKGKGKGQWCTNCQSPSHWTSSCWNRNAMQIGSITEDEASWTEDQWHEGWHEESDVWPDSVWHLDDWNSSEWYDDGWDSAWTEYDDGWSSHDWQGQSSTTNPSHGPSSTQLLALPPSGPATSSGSQSSPFAPPGSTSTARVGAVVSTAPTSASTFSLQGPRPPTARDYIVTVGEIDFVAMNDSSGRLAGARILFDTGATLHVCPMWFG